MQSYASGVRTVYSSQNVGTTNWFILFPSLTLTVSAIEIFDSSGQTLEIGTCGASDPANSEVRQLIIPPGGNGYLRLQITQSQRISIRAISGTASVGENNTNVYF